jgi:hypothetical protein
MKINIDIQPYFAHASKSKELQLQFWWCECYNELLHWHFFPKITKLLLKSAWGLGCYGENAFNVVIYFCNLVNITNLNFKHQIETP